jgi:hypothetical protein
MTAVIETSNGWWFASATVTCSPTVPATTPRRGVGLIVKTASRSRAPNTWRGQLDWRHSRLHGRPGQGRMWQKCDRASWPRQGSSMTGERTQGKAPS